MPWIKSSRHLEEEIEVASDGLLVQDHDGYGIGPHTDAPHRLVSTLFYCPATGDDADLGTSLYVPTDEAGIDLKISPKHFDRRLFSKIYTAPYIPNCLFGFVVSPNSFHGVDKIERPTIRRNAILHFCDPRAAEGRCVRVLTQPSSFIVPRLTTHAYVDCRPRDFIWMGILFVLGTYVLIGLTTTKKPCPNT